MSVAVTVAKEGEKQMNTGMNNAINLFIRKLSEKLMGFSQDGAWRAAAVAALVFATSLPQGAQATVFVKANSGTLGMNVAGSWTNNAVPVASDITLWDNNTLTPAGDWYLYIGGNLSVDSIRLTNSNTGEIIIMASGNSVLTLNSSGTAIDIPAASRNLKIQSYMALAANQTWNIGASRTFTVSAPISGGFSLTQSGSGTLTLSSSNTFSGALTVMGGTLNLTGSNTYSGATTVNGGTMNVNGVSGSILNTSGIAVSSGASLAIGDTANFLADRINNAATVTLGGGNLTFQGKNSTATTETIGALTIGAGGESAVTVTPGSSSTATLTLTSIPHSGTGGSVTFKDTGTIATSQALSNNILGGWAIWGSATSGQRGNAVTTNASGNLTYLTTFDKTYTVTTNGINDWTATQNIYFDTTTAGITATLSASANQSVNSLTFGDINNTTLDLGGKTLTLTSGGIFMPYRGNSKNYGIQNGTITAGSGTAPAELFITGANYNYNAYNTISAIIADNNSQAVSVVQRYNPSDLAAGAFVGNLLSGINSYSGGTYINTGYLYINNDNNLGAVGGAVYFQGRSVGINGDQGGTLRPFSTMTLNASRNIVAASNATATIDTSYAATKSAVFVLTIAGKVTGAGNFAKKGTVRGGVGDTGPLAGTVILTNPNNDWAGTTTVPSGILQIGDGTTTAGSLPDRPVSLSGANTTLKFANPTAVNFNSVISGSGDLIKSGAGTMTLDGVNTYSNGTTISGGILAISSDASLGAAYDGSVSGATVTNLGSGYCVSGNTNWPFTFSAPPSGTTASGSNTAAYVLGAQGQLRNVTWLSGGAGYVAPPTAFVGGAGSGGGIQAYVKGLLTLDGGTLQTTAGITSSRAVYLTSNNGAIDTAGNSSTFSGVFNGPGRLTKTGAGTLTLSATNTYTGGTVVSNGTLFVNGAVTGMVDVVGGTLGGTGIVAGVVSNNASGTIMAGVATNTIGTLTVSNLVMNSGASLIWKYNATVTSSDLINISGALTIPSASVATVTVSRVSGTAWPTNSSVLFSAGSISGSPSGWVLQGDCIPGSVAYVKGNQVLIGVPTGMLIYIN